jgi:SAM-dependent methyltransferase
MNAPCSDLNSSAYDAFAPFYDAFTAGSDYDAFAEHVLEAIIRHGFAGKRLLDLACGTGNSFVPFMGRGFRVTGCDASPAMLVQARLKAPAAELVRCDLRDLRVLGCFDLVTCLDDSLNHLSDELELASAFAGIARNLRAGGMVVFDLNSLLAYRTTFATSAVSELDAVVFAWRGLGSADAGRGCTAEARIDVFAPRRDGTYERAVTHHRQRHFARERVVELLAEASLECVAVHGVLPDASLDATADEGRHLKVLYTARRAEGGER